MDPVQRQELLEIRFSKKLCFETLRCAVQGQLSDALENWTIACGIALQDYLGGQYYKSKTKRLTEFKSLLKEKGLDWLLSITLASLLKEGKDQTIQQAVAHLGSHLNHDTEWENIVTAGELIAVLGKAGNFWSIEREQNGLIEDEQPKVKLHYWPFLTKLFQLEIEWSADTHSNPPLVVPPKEVSNNFNNGYHVVEEKVLLGRFTDTTDNIALDVINRLNSLPWKLDQDTLAIGERPPKPLIDMEEIENFEKHKKQSQRLYDIIGEDALWMIWQYDSRGRIYSHGHHVQFQSYEYKKAMLNFDHYEELTV
jgi:hypothetical protein